MAELTTEEIAELRHLHAIATDRSVGAMARADAQAKVSDLMTWNGFDGGDGILPALLDMAERCAKADAELAKLLEHQDAEHGKDDLLRGDRQVDPWLDVPLPEELP